MFALYEKGCERAVDVVFGEVIQGEDVIKTVEGFGSSSGKTTKKIVIADCGMSGSMTKSANKN